MSELPPPPPSGDAPPPGWSGGQPGGWQQQPGPGQPWPPQPGQPGPGMPWQAQPWGYVQAREHPQGTTILVLGILSLVVCQVLGPFAWKMGNTALKEMDGQRDVTWSNRGNVTAGRILGIVSSVLLIIGVAFFVLWLIFAVAVVSST